MQQTGARCSRLPHVKKKEAAMAMASAVGAMDDEQEKGTVQASAFKVEETGKCSDVRGKGSRVDK